MREVPLKFERATGLKDVGYSVVSGVEIISSHIRDLDLQEAARIDPRVFRTKLDVERNYVLLYIDPREPEGETTMDEKQFVPIFVGDHGETHIVGRAALNKLLEGEVLVRGTIFPADEQQFGKPIENFTIRVPKLVHAGAMRWLNTTDLLLNPVEPDPDKRIVFRQVGWQGFSGRFYPMGARPEEAGGFSPIYCQIGD